MYVRMTGVKNFKESEDNKPTTANLAQITIERLTSEFAALLNTTVVYSICV